MIFLFVLKEFLRLSIIFAVIMKNFNYKAIRALWNLGAMLPFKVLYLLSDIIYFVIYYVARYRRKVVRDNLVNSFPEKSLPEIVEIEKKFYSSFCDYIVETLKLMRMSPERIKKHIRFEGVEKVEQMLSGEGKSSMVYIGHLFNWEYITSLTLHFKNPEIRFGQIYHPLENMDMDRLFLELRGQYGSESIAMKNTLRRILELSHEKKPFIIGSIADQVPTWESIKHWLTFFHRETPVFTGSEKIGRRIGSSFYYLALRREKRGYYVGTFHLICEDASKTEENEVTNKYFTLLEKNIKEEPYLWLWTHKRWKRTRQGHIEREKRRAQDLQRLKEKS